MKIEMSTTDKELISVIYIDSINRKKIEQHNRKMVNGF